MIQEFSFKKINKKNGFQKNNKKTKIKEMQKLTKNQFMLFRLMNLTECRYINFKERIIRR